MNADYARPKALVEFAAMPLWSILNEGRLVSCVLRDFGRLGVEAQILVDGDLSVQRRFKSKELACDGQRQSVLRPHSAGPTIEHSSRLGVDFLDSSAKTWK